MSEKNYYEILGVDYDAGADEIRKAYKHLCELYENDSVKLQKIKDAWRVLGSPRQRESYDRKINVALLRQTKKPGQPTRADAPRPYPIPRLEGPAKTETPESSSPFQPARTDVPQSCHSSPLQGPAETEMLELPSLTDASQTQLHSPAYEPLETDIEIKTIGRYTLEEKIGGGGYGVVYRATTSDHQTFAIKVLNPQLSGQPHFEARFEQEALALRRLPAHPCIVRLLNYGWLRNPTRLYLVMEYLPGQDLHRLMDSGSLPVRQAVSIAAQVAKALEAAASIGLIHCDIKPGNIRVLPDGMIKVLDFGIARAVSSTVREAIGTRAYMAPELWRGEPVPATDVYALGCVLYEMLTGRPPFISDNPDDRAQREEIKHLHQAAEPDWQPLDGVVPPELLFLLQAMLAKSPAERPSAGRAATQLRQLEQIVPGNETRLHPSEQGGPIIYRPPTPRTPYVATTPPATPSTGPASVSAQVKRGLSPLDLRADVCSAALVHAGGLFTGTIEGDVVWIDLATGCSQRWHVIPRDQVVSYKWAFAALRRDRILFHAGGEDWFEMDVSEGQVVRSGTLPEREMTLIVLDQWLYMRGRERLYRASIDNLDQRDEFDLGARLTGDPYVTPGAVFAPTRRGLVWLDTGLRRATQVGLDMTALAITSMHHGRRIAVLYRSPLAEDGSQTSWVRLFDASVLPPVLLAEAMVPGQCIGAAQVSGDRIIVPCLNGRIWAWDALQQDEWQLRPAWPDTVKVRSGIQHGATLGSAGLLALVSGQRSASVLLVLNTAGQTISEHPLPGDIAVPPVWWGATLSIILANGQVQVFNVTIER